MKKTIPFDLFEQGQTIYFDIMRLGELENAFGRSLAPGSFLARPQLSISETVAGLIVGLRHHYPKGNAEFYEQKIDEYLERSDRDIEIIADHVLRAIMATGVYGKSLNELVNGKKEEQEKND